MAYTVKKNLAGKRRVHYVCPHCQGQLESPLEEAGQEFSCPTCNRSIITPGQRELGLQRQADQAKEQERENQRRQTAAAATATATAAAAARQQSEANARAEAARHLRLTQEKERERIEQADRMSPADKILEFAFRAAKMISVIVIICGAVTMAICLVKLATVHATMPPPVQPFVAPTEADFQTHLRESNSPNTSTPDQSASASPAGSTDLISLGRRFAAVLTRFNIADDFRANEFGNYERAEQIQLVDGLEKFAGNIHQGTAEEGANAVQWYIDTFDENWKANALEQKIHEDDKQIASEAASATRQELLVAIGIAFAALLAFLFLPLLIQVERNTRRTLELTAAANKGKITV